MEYSGRQGLSVSGDLVMRVLAACLIVATIAPRTASSAEISPRILLRDGKPSFVQASSPAKSTHAEALHDEKGCSACSKDTKGPAASSAFPAAADSDEATDSNAGAQPGAPASQSTPPHHSHRLRNILIIVAGVTVMYVILGSLAK